ncbi:Acriflavin resistance protein [Alcanivorax nanhaiticus]|uniref:Acriflavin resistance protein n=1 Tax=Alcanivorax nanhaiticus TaxID=1177154 RepID=A0A095SH88_9GAMM|nr:efflux RND transporter permease subunit [Alcanivorax nanhaiticus]KGD63996.1 Acriflavin resistance protein [Alcanivorax nanhaiticus]
MNRSIAWFAGNSAVANLLMITLLLAGILAIPMTRQETLPNVPLDRIGIYVAWPQATPENVESLLCSPVETAIDDVEGGTELISESREGLCSVQLDVLEGHDTRSVLEQIRTRLEGLDTLPRGADRPRVQELVVRNRVVRLLVSGSLSRKDLYQLAQKARRQLLNHEAVSSVDIENLPEREMSLQVDRDDLYRYQLTLDGMAATASQSVQRIAGGLLRSERGDWLLQTGEQPGSAQAYEDLAIRQSEQGDLLRLGHVARVDDGFSRDNQAAWLNGQPAVALDVYRVGDQNVLAVADAVKQWMAETDLPSGVSLRIWSDDARQFQERSSLLWRNALQGLVLLTIMLAIFLTLRLAGWVALGIPVCMLGACALLPLLGESFNTISLFAFILVLGIVVDDAVIVGESIDHQRRQGLSGPQAAVSGAQRVAKPLLFAVLTTIFAFAPLLFLPGPEGALMRVIPIVSIAILVLSLVESLWILPAHLSHGRPPRGIWLKSERLANRINERLERWLDVKARPLLRRALQWRYVLVIVFLGLFLFCCALVNSGWLTMVLFSRVEGDRVMAEVVFPQGTGDARLLREVQALEGSARRLSSTLEQEHAPVLVDAVFAEQGVRQKTSNAQDPGARFRVRVTLAVSGETGQLTPRELAARWREQHGPIPDALSVKFHASLMAVKPDIHLNLFHSDLATLQRMSEQAALTLSQMDGVHEVANNLHAKRTIVEINLREEGRLAGLRAEEVGSQVRNAFHGIELDRWFEQDQEVPVMLRLSEQDSRNLIDLEKLPLKLPDGEMTLLAAVADLSRRQAPAMISHYDGRRSATVSAFVDEHTTSPALVMQRLQETLLDPLTQADEEAGWTVAGKQAAVQDFLDRLSISYLIALAAIFFLLTVLFGRYGQPLLVMAAIPFGMVGAFLGHFLLGYSLTLWSLVGVIAVSGVVVNDNLVLIDAINEFKARGKALRDAVVEGVSGRLRPVMLTSITTFAGVAPLMLETSVQARFLIPMAVALAFGVLFATLVSLLLVPCLLVIGHDVNVAWLRWQARWRAPEASELDTVEVAYERGQLTAWWGANNPYDDPVLRSAWEAGRQDHGNDGEAPQHLQG